MRCWKCKSEMPEGLKYCGNCGVHMNRAVHFFQWLFSKKGLPVLLLLLALIVGGIIWAVVKYVDFPDTDIHVDLPGDGSSREPLENQYDFGVYPNVGSFLAGDTKDGGLFQHADLYTHIEGAMVSFSTSYNETTQVNEFIVNGNHPHWWAHYVCVPALEDEISDYLELLDDIPFHFELVHQQYFEGNEFYDAGEYYFYHYDGVQNVFTLTQPSFVESDLGELNFIIRVDSSGEEIHFETWIALGLESIYREERDDILNDVPYHRTVDGKIITEE